MRLCFIYHSYGSLSWCILVVVFIGSLPVLGRHVVAALVAAIVAALHQLEATRLGQQGAVLTQYSMAWHSAPIAQRSTP